MLYNGNAARYAQADRMREAEQARLARQIAKRQGPSAARKVATSTLLTVLTFGLKH